MLCTSQHASGRGWIYLNTHIVDTCKAKVSSVNILVFHWKMVASFSSYSLPHCLYISKQWSYNLCQTPEALLEKTNTQTLAFTHCWTASMWDRLQFITRYNLCCSLSTAATSTHNLWLMDYFKYITFRPLPPSGVKDWDNNAAQKYPPLQHPILFTRKLVNLLW